MTSAPAFAYTIVYVSNVAASLEFFERAFGIARRFLHESGGYGELDTGQTVLAFAQHEVARENLGQDYAASDSSALPLGMEIALATPDVAGICERAVEAGARLLQPPKTKPWGQTVAYLSSPDGTLIEVCTPMG